MAGTGACTDAAQSGGCGARLRVRRGKPTTLADSLSRVLLDWLHTVSWEQWDGTARSARSARPPATARPAVALPWHPPRLMTVLLRRHLRLVNAGPLVVVPPNELRGVRFGDHVHFHLLWRRGDDLAAVTQRLVRAFASEAERPSPQDRKAQ